MSLGKLLTTGKSLVGLSQSGSRYHLQKGALPKFESAKNPFASKAPAEPAEREPQLPKLSPDEAAAADLKKPQPLSALGALIVDRETAVAASRNSQSAEAAKISEPAKVAAPVDSWLKKINPLVWFSNRKPATEPKPAIPRFSKPHAPIQGELSLENIKVMRNDLSEADVEVVPVKARAPKVVATPMPQAGAAAMALPVPDLPPATRAWEFIGEHLMGKH